MPRESKTGRRFEFELNGVCIGWSLLETGDPPMGCAEGVFHWEDLSLETKARLDKLWSPEVQAFRGEDIAVCTATGEQVICIGVVVYEMGADFGSYVDVVGINSPSYEELFPGRYDAYEAEMRRHGGLT